MAVTQYNKKFSIIGAGGFGRELHSWMLQTSNIPTRNFTGFIDDDSNALVGFKDKLLYLGTIEEQLHLQESIIIAVTNPLYKAPIYKRCLKNGLKILGFISESCFIGARSCVGDGFVAFPNSVVSCDVSIEDGVFINCGTQVGHDVQIGRYTSVMANVDIGGHAVIGNNVFIGSGVTILPNVKIPDDCIIGAGSVVFKTIKTKGTYIGNPAKRIF